MRDRLTWAAIYSLVFVLSLGGGVLLAAKVPGGDFAGIPKVDWTDAMGSIETDLRYGDGALNTFDLYLPADKARATKLVLYIHAGGFTEGDKADDANIGTYFASKGYVGATINYSLAAETNNVTVTQITGEIKRGVQAIVAAARQRGYPLDGMVVAGGSAGGALAMIYAYRDAAGAPVPVTAVISLVGPAGFDPADWFGFTEGYASQETATAGAGFVQAMTGEPVTPEMMRSGAYRQALEPISAAALFSADAPPTLAAWGELDRVAPYAASREFAQKLQASSVPNDVLLFPNSGHALNRDPDMNRQLGAKIEEYLDRYAPLG